MTYKVIFSVLILAFNTAFFEYTGANIFIKKADNRTNEITFECGKNVTLTCMFKNSFGVEWMNEKNETGIAWCVQNKCTLTPVYVGQYSISSDMLRKIFNLTILKVTMKDDGRRLVCSDGSYTDSVILRVNDNTPRLLEDTQSGTIKAASGCVSLGTKVSFKWKKISIIDNFEEEFFPKIQFKNSRSCQTDADCGHDHTEIVYVTANEDGQYHFKIVALYGSEIKESDISVMKYITKPKGTGNGNHLNTPFGVIVPVTLCLSIIAVLVILTLIVIFRKEIMNKWRKRKTYQDNRSQRNRQQHNEETATFSANDRDDEETPLQRPTSDGDEGSLPANRNNDEIHSTNQQQDIKKEINKIISSGESNVQKRKDYFERKAKM
ncbi:uncharacterized protein LOC132737645 [Ruditapes philippinarum]|uniref:uncharacterized protein LOC132737645 n=1 Tax=Ruditapes philippinarum TaxID=129788 RepID=UPI00295B0DBC|nr:uncharacterized protein LOC132737645 [Ruditapes philippinarum]